MKILTYSKTVKIQTAKVKTAKICLLLAVSLGWIWSVYQSTLGMISENMVSASARTENIFLSHTYAWLFFNFLALVCFGLFVLLATNLRGRLVVVVAGIVCTVTLTLQVLSPIGISTDYYRYIWQGRLSNAGQNSYNFVPWDAGVENANKELFERMDWRDVKSVYPPLAEQYFRIPAGIFDSAILKDTSFQTRLNASRLPSLVLFMLCAFLLYKITGFKLVPQPPYSDVSEQQSNVPVNSSTSASVPTGTHPKMSEPPVTFASCPDIHHYRVVGALVGFVWLGLPFLQFELVNSAHVDVLSIALVLGAVLSLKSKHLATQVLAGSLIAAAGMVKLTPLVLIIPATAYSLVHFSLKKAVAVVAGFTAVLAASVQPYIINGFALSKRTLFWLGGGEFSIGNPLYEIAKRISSHYGAALLKVLAISLGAAVIISIVRKVVSKQFTFNEMLKYSLLLILIPFIASPIVLPWYWITALALLLILIVNNHQRLKPINVLVLVLGIALLLAQYIDRAIKIAHETRVLFLIISSLLFYALFLVFITKLLSNSNRGLRNG